MDKEIIDSILKSIGLESLQNNRNQNSKEIKVMVERCKSWHKKKN